MKKSGYWLIKENVIEESKKYSSRSEFQKFNNGAYQSARKNGWLDEMTWLLRPKVHNFKWTKEKVFEESKRYSSRNEFSQKSVSAYQVANKNNWLGEMTWLNPLKKKWSKEEIFEYGKKYSSRGEFQKEDSVHYQYALKHKWLGEMVWLKNKIKPKYYWDNNANIINESKKYTTKSEFINQSKNVYELARKRGLLKYMTWLYREGSKRKYCVYCYLDEINYVIYVGLTSDIKNRHIQHSSGMYKGKISQSSVFEYFTNIRKNVPQPIILLDKLNDLESQYWEDFYIKEFKSMGFNVLNVAKTGIGCGSLGRTKLKWTDEKLIEESKKYSSRSEFEKGNCSAYQTSLRRKLINEMVWLIPKRKKKMNKIKIKEFINNTDIRILTLDGSDIYGKQTMNGSKYLWLSDNVKCQDNYKIGKFYNSQRWERFDAIIYKENDVPKIKLCTNGEIPNAYIVYSKRVFRKNTNQTRASSAVIINQITKNVNNFIEELNNVFYSIE